MCADLHGNARFCASENLFGKTNPARFNASKKPTGLAVGFREEMRPIATQRDYLRLSRQICKTKPKWPRLTPVRINIANLRGYLVSISLDRTGIGFLLHF